MNKTNGTIWNEHLHETRNPRVQAVHPEDIHWAMAQGLEETDALLWWSHMAHDRAEDAIIERVQLQVLSGMGLIVLHSGHHSKIFKQLMNTFCSLKRREAGARAAVESTSRPRRLHPRRGSQSHPPRGELPGRHPGRACGDLHQPERARGGMAGAGHREEAA